MTVKNQKGVTSRAHLLYVKGVTSDSVKKYLQDKDNKAHLVEWLELVVRESLSSIPLLHTESTACYCALIFSQTILMPILSVMQLMSY
jgi:hypothetical protein